MRAVEIQSSKSIMNRLLIVKSYFPDLYIDGFSDSEDVKLMLKAVENLQSQNSFECGHAGTVLRFLALRLSREKGNWQLTGQKRLFQRPQVELKNIFDQLCVQAIFSENCLTLKSDGWKPPRTSLVIKGNDSSQFASAVFLNSWNLEMPLDVEFQGEFQSFSYFKMTFDLLKELGMEIVEKQNKYLISANQKLKLNTIRAEADASSAFAIATVAAASGAIKIKNSLFSKLQPDHVFVDLLKRMGVKIALQNQDLVIEKCQDLSPLDYDCNNAPDLFPVLCVLCSFAKGVSRIYGAENLKIKESNRILKTYELLTRMGISCTELSDGLVIHGGTLKQPVSELEFDPDQDHRMAMAAGLLVKSGFNIKIKNPEVVNKSFPEFWQILGIIP